MELPILKELFQQHVLNKIMVTHPPCKDLGLDNSRRGILNNEFSITSTYKHVTDMGNFTYHRN